MTYRGVRILCGATAIVSAAACSGDSAVTPDVNLPQPLAAAAGPTRTLAVELAKPDAPDGGIIFSIEGPNILSISPAAGLELTSYGSDSRGRMKIDVLVVGPLSDGVIAWLTVRGVNSGAPFDAQVSQVAAGAAGGFAQRGDLGAYRVTVRR